MRGEPEIITPEETLDEYEAACRASAIKGMRKEEARWQKRSLCFSWIDAEPVWVGVSEWRCFLGPEFGEVERPCKRIMRFALLGGGQIRTTEHLKEHVYFLLRDILGSENIRAVRLYPASMQSRQRLPLS
jgi:hypothetical protein